MRHVFRLNLARSITVVVIVALATIGANPSPARANIFTEWAFILEYPSGNLNAFALMTLQGGQLAGSAFISGKHCRFRVSGTFDGNAGSGGTFAMTWSGRGECSGETLSLIGDIVNREITGTFSDTSEPEILDLTGTVLFGAR